MSEDRTHAARQARYRDRQNARFIELQNEVTRLRAQLASRDGTGESVSRDGAQPGQLERIREVEARVQELEAELARERGAKAKPLPNTPEEWAAAKQAATEERRATRAARKAERAAAAATANEVSETPEELRASRDALTTQLKARNTQIANLKQRLASMRDALDHARKGGTHLTKQVDRDIKACLHPDRARDDTERKRLEKAFQGYTAIFKTTEA